MSKLMFLARIANATFHGQPSFACGVWHYWRCGSTCSQQQYSDHGRSRIQDTGGQCTGCRWPTTLQCHFLVSVGVSAVLLVTCGFKTPISFFSESPHKKSIKLLVNCDVCWEKTMTRVLPGVLWQTECHSLPVWEL